MIIGTGIDIIENARVAEKIGKANGFKEKVFSASEITYCESVANPIQNFAARFAAKEAFLKATGHGLLLGWELSEIEITSDEKGKPGMVLHGIFKEEALKNNWNRIHVSLSHVQEMSCAVVIIEQ
ncbi:MAG: holo-[acyl-carrier-protein] synthase [Azospira oryzae]|nr:MAG: holo-[acyl-carrier-protein] synthase [Azospira oryzae]